MDNFLKELPKENIQALVMDEEGYVELDRLPSTVVASPSKTVVVSPSTEEPKPIKQEVISVEDNTKPADEVRVVEVTVKRGDALEKIARSNGTTVDAIKKANNLNSSKLSIGQVLKVPLQTKNAKNAAVASKPAASKTSNSTVATNTKASTSEPQYYTIKSGDNPWKIAKQFQVKFEDLLKLNGLDEEKARNLKAGDKIRVR